MVLSLSLRNVVVVVVVVVVLPGFLGFLIVFPVLSNLISGLTQALWLGADIRLTSLGAFGRR